MEGRKPENQRLAGGARRLGRVEAAKRLGVSTRSLRDPSWRPRLEISRFKRDSFVPYDGERLERWIFGRRGPRSKVEEDIRERTPVHALKGQREFPLASNGKA